MLLLCERLLYLASLLVAARFGYFWFCSVQIASRGSKGWVVYRAQRPILWHCSYWLYLPLDVLRKGAGLHVENAVRKLIEDSYVFRC